MFGMECFNGRHTQFPIFDSRLARYLDNLEFEQISCLKKFWNSDSFRDQ